ncbi:LOW QUALITY PROTEIN: uncharacterized protein LOC100375545 [Saccoglossus kowalevskii]
MKLLNDPMFTHCHTFVNPQYYYENCKFDVCSCQQTDCHCVIFADYAHDCAEKGVPLIGWRQEILTCGVECSSGMIYTECGSACQVTADTLREGIECNDQSCVPGCRCPEMFVEKDGECVYLADLPCERNGEMFEAGREIPHGCGSCTCINAAWECVDIECPAVECGNHEVYTDCKSVCPATCENMQINEGCSSALCEAGCECANGFVHDGEKCVRPSRCPCHHGGDTYRNGAVLESDCQRCVCQSGTWSCEEMECSGVCYVYGDPHYNTFDGVSYDFQGECDYILSQTTSDNSEKYRISAKNIKCGTSGVTCTKDIIIRIGTIHERTTVKLIRGKDPQVMSQNGPPVEIVEMTIFTFVYTNIGLVVKWDRGTRVYIIIDGRHHSKVEGLCGNFNGKQKDDFTAPGGGFPLESPIEFGNSWKLHECCPDAPDIEDTCALSPERKTWAMKGCSVIKSDLFKPCHCVVPFRPFLRRCKYDACGCDMGGDCECMCTAIAAYANECSRHGIHIKWRSQELCPIMCDGCLVYDPCISPCKDTCVGRYYEHHYGHCQDSCVEGCRCPDGQAWNGEECVNECPTVPPTLPPTTTMVPETTREITTPHITTAPPTPIPDTTTEPPPPDTTKPITTTVTVPTTPTEPQKPPCLCYGFGDPHYQSFDGKWFSHQGVCTYVLARPQDAPYDFQVLIDNVECTWQPETSCTKEIIVIYGGHTVVLMRMGKVKVDGEMVELPVNIDDSIFVELAGMQTVLRIPDIGLDVRFEGVYHTYSVLVPSELYWDRTEGICGPCNGDQSDDFQLRNGTVVEDVDDFVHDWFVPVRNDSDCPPPLPSRPCDIPSEECKQLCEPIMSNLFEDCHNIIDWGHYYENCLYDCCQCDADRKDRCSCDGISAYARECSYNGICIEWRSEDVCPFECPEDMYYTECGPACNITLSNCNENKECDLLPAPGCFCHDDFVKTGDECLPCPDESGSGSGEETTVEYTTRPTTAEPTTSRPVTTISTEGPTDESGSGEETTVEYTTRPTTSEPTTSRPVTTIITEGPTDESGSGEETTVEYTTRPTTAEPTTSRPTTAEPTTSRPVTTIITEGPTDESGSGEETTIEYTTRPTTAEPTTSRPVTTIITEGPTDESGSGEETTVEYTTRPTTAESTTSRPVTTIITEGPTTAEPTTSCIPVSEELCDYILSDVFEECEGDTSRLEYYDLCIDLCEDEYCEFLEGFAKDCQSECVEWRNHACPAVCPYGLEYMECGNTCNNTCNNNCDGSIQPGCYCPHGTYDKNGNCCPCCIAEMGCPEDLPPPTCAPGLELHSHTDDSGCCSRTIYTCSCPSECDPLPDCDAEHEELELVDLGSCCPHYRCRRRCVAVEKEPQMFEIDGCVSVHPIKLSECHGGCRSVSKYSHETNAIENRCECCQGTQFQTKHVPLSCEDGREDLYEYEDIVECQCLPCEPGVIITTPEPTTAPEPTTTPELATTPEPTTTSELPTTAAPTSTILTTEASSESEESGSGETPVPTTVEPTTTAAPTTAEQTTTPAPTAEPTILTTAASSDQKRVEVERHLPQLQLNQQPQPPITETTVLPTEASSESEESGSGETPAPTTAEPTTTAAPTTEPSISTTEVSSEPEESGSGETPVPTTAEPTTTAAPITETTVLPTEASSESEESGSGETPAPTTAEPTTTAAPTTEPTISTTEASSEPEESGSGETSAPTTAEATTTAVPTAEPTTTTAPITETTILPTEASSEPEESGSGEPSAPTTAEATTTAAPTAGPTTTTALTAEPTVSTAETPSESEESGSGDTPAPTTAEPTTTASPTVEPTTTGVPTAEPTTTAAPTAEPTTTAAPTAEPTTTAASTAEPTTTAAPTAEPTTTAAPKTEPTSTTELKTTIIQTSTAEPTTTACIPTTEWSEWMDDEPHKKVDPLAEGEFELYSDLHDLYDFCESPVDIECRVKSPYEHVTGPPHDVTGQQVSCDVDEGLRCYHSDQMPPMCYNYEIRVLCEKPCENQETTAAPTGQPTTDARSTERPPTRTSSAEEPSTEQPTTGTPSTGSPTTEEASTEQPSTEPLTTEPQSSELPSTGTLSTKLPTTEAPYSEHLTTGTPSTEPPTTGTPSTEPPTTEAPSTEQPTTGTPSTEPPTTGVSSTKQPTTGTPFTEPPTTATPSTEPPTTEQPTSGTPSTEPRTTGVSSTEHPTTGTPSTEPPTTATPSTEPPTTEQPTSGTPSTEPRTTGVSSTEHPTTGTPSTEPPTTGTPSTEPPTTEEPSTEQPSTGTPSTEPPTTEVSSTEQPSTGTPSTEPPTTEVSSSEQPSTGTPYTEPPNTNSPTTNPGDSSSKGSSSESKESGGCTGKDCESKGSSSDSKESGGCTGKSCESNESNKNKNKPLLHSSNATINNTIGVF